MHGARMSRSLAATALAASLAVGATVGVAAQDEDVSLSYLVTDVQFDLATGLVDAYTAMNPNVKIDIEVAPGGEELDNLVKTRLATGEMNDIFFYNSGSLLQAINPTETLVDLSGEAFLDNVAESFLATVAAGDGLYGVPTGTAMGGGILYNRAVYADLGLEVPTTWDEFSANNEILMEAGIAPVAQTYFDAWTAQLLILADYYNVNAAVPGFADMYTANEASYSDTPAAMAGFGRLQEGFEKGWWQEDFGSASFEDGLNLLVEGEVAHYPMLTFAAGNVGLTHPDKVGDIGFFAQPGDDAEMNGATIWMPSATYIPKTTENVEAALGFLGFIASVEGTEAQAAAVAPTGPYPILGATLPADAPQVAHDTQAYIEAGAAYPALEYVSPVKGPSLPQITVEVGSGLRSAVDAAALYDQDVEKQAKQLGLEGW